MLGMFVMPRCSSTGILLSLLVIGFLQHTAHAVEQGSVTYHQKSPSRQDATADADRHVDLPSGYVHQVPSAFHPQPARAYPGDLSDFLLPPPAPVVRKRVRVVSGSRRTTSRADPDPAAKPEDNAKASEEVKSLELASTVNLPAYSAPEGSTNRFVDTEAEFSFNGAGFLLPVDGSKSKDGNKNPERQDQRQDQRHDASINSPQRLRHRHPMVQKPPTPFGLPNADALHIAQSAPEINYYPSLPSLGYPGFPEFGYRFKREVVPENSSKPKKMHKTIKLYLHRMLMNKSLVAKPKKTAHLDKMVKLDTKLQAEASEYHSESGGFQASYPYFQHSQRYPYEQATSRDSLRVRDRRPNRHQLYATETRSYGYGHDNLGSGNFEIIRGGIYSDGHAASSHNPVQSASYNGGGGGDGDGDGYDYDDEDGEPILGFQGYNNFGSLHNALASRKRVTSIPIAGRRSSSGHVQSHASQLIPMNADLLAMD